MSFRSRLALSTAIGVLILLGFVWGRSILSHRPPGMLIVSIRPAQILADGHSVATLRIEIEAGHSRAGLAKVTVVEGQHRAAVQDVHETEHGWFARIRAGVTPGRALL